MNCNSSSTVSIPILPLSHMLAVGYRFHPTDEELIINYLRPKIRCPLEDNLVIGEVNVCKYEPRHLPDVCKIKSDDQVWHFFCPCEFKYQNSRRLNRTTKEGYWKPTGKPIPIKAKRAKKKIGTKKTLVFYKGRGKGVRTGWIMHEYEYIGDSNLPNQGGFVLCKLKKKPEKMHKGKPNKHVALTPNFDSGESSQNLSEVMANSADEADFENQNSNQILVSASFNESGLPDIENGSNSEIYQRSLSQFESEWSWRPSMAIPSNLENGSTYDNGESSSQLASDCGTQNLGQVPDISTFEEGEWSAFISMLSNVGDQNHKKTDMSTSLDQNSWSSPENTGAEAMLAEENPQYAELYFDPEVLLENISNSAPTLLPTCSD